MDNLILSRIRGIDHIVDRIDFIDTYPHVWIRDRIRWLLEERLARWPERRVESFVGLSTEMEDTWTH